MHTVTMTEEGKLSPSSPALGTLTPAHLTRARLRIAWEMLSQVGEHADLLPPSARAHVAQALASLVQAKALVAERESAYAFSLEQGPACPTG